MANTAKLQVTASIDTDNGCVVLRDNDERIIATFENRFDTEFTVDEFMIMAHHAARGINEAPPFCNGIRTGILCPNCMKKSLLRKQTTADAWCDNCLQQFEIIGPNQVRYKDAEAPHT